MPYEPIIPEDQHLGKSHNEDDAVTGHLFDNDTNQLRGHAAWRWVDEPDDEDDYDYSDYKSEPRRQLTQEEIEAAAALAALILTGIVWVVTEGTPRFVVWWNARVVPTMKAAWIRVKESRLITKLPDAEAASEADRATFVASPDGVELVIEHSKISMSSAEWTQRFRAMLAAGAFKDEQRRILANAHIEDAGSALGGKETAEQLTAGQFVERIKMMLKENPSLLDRETSAELIRIFRVPNPADGIGQRRLGG